MTHHPLTVLPCGTEASHTASLSSPSCATRTDRSTSHRSTGCNPVVSHSDTTGGQLLEERPADHLDRVWPDAGPGDRPVAACSPQRKRTGRPDRWRIAPSGNDCCCEWATTYRRSG